MAVVAVIDDHRLLSLLMHPQPPPGRWATTCSWWWRLTSALGSSRSGALTARVEDIGAGAGVIREMVARLDSYLEIVDLRKLIPAMGELASITSVNQLAAEAVASAAYLRAPVEVEVDSPLIRNLSEQVGVEYRVVS